MCWLGWGLEGIYDVQQRGLIRHKSFTSTLTSNQCYCFFFFFSPIIKMWRRKCESCSSRQLSGGLEFIVLSLYWEKCEKWEAAFPRLQDYLSRPCCKRHSDVGFLVFLQTLDLKGKRHNRRLEIHVFVGCNADLREIKPVAHIKRDCHCSRMNRSSGGHEEIAVVSVCET